MVCWLVGWWKKVWKISKQRRLPELIVHLCLFIYRLFSSVLFSYLLWSSYGSYFPHHWNHHSHSLSPLSSCATSTISDYKSPSGTGRGKLWQTARTRVLNPHKLLRLKNATRHPPHILVFFFCWWTRQHLQISMSSSSQEQTKQTQTQYQNRATRYPKTRTSHSSPSCCYLSGSRLSMKRRGSEGKNDDI